MKSEILRLLKESDDYISGQQMCDRFHVSRTAVWKAIEQLKKEVYEANMELPKRDRGGAQ